jgi:glycine/D-amino acid oxidase-like deaminating enzyme
MWPFQRNPSRAVRSATPYWLLRDGIGDARRPENGSDFDVAIVGAGISGALVADALLDTGWRIVVIDSGEPGLGSTAASTALLQYEIDTHLVDLTKRLGADRAARAYRACADSFGKLERRFPELLPSADYERHQSLYLASDERAVAELQVELAARRAIGLECEWLDGGEVMRRHGCHRPGAILSALGAQIDPLRFTRALLAGCERHGVAIRTRTRVRAIHDSGPRLELAIEDVRGTGTLVASDVIVCAGYESLQFLPADVADVADVHNTFALVTDPLADPRRAAIPLMWESARPYLYLRGTRDGRLIVGGADLPFEDATARELLLPRQLRRLSAGYEDLFGEALPPVATSWAGSFAETRDGLPYIGPLPGGDPRLQFVLAYGGNGITYSVQAADMVRAHLERRPHELDDVFGFERDASRFAVSGPRGGQTKRQRGDRASA